MHHLAATSTPVTGRGRTAAVIAHGDHVADVVASGELDRLRETIEVLSDTELVRDLREGLADARAGRVFPPGRLLTWPRAGPLADERARAVRDHMYRRGRRRLDRLPLSAAAALYEHLASPAAGNPYRLGKPLDAPFEDVLFTRRGGYRALDAGL